MCTCTLASRNSRLTLVTTTHDQQRLLLGESLLSQLLQRLVHHQDSLDLSGNLVQAVDDLLTTLLLGDGIVRELECHHDEGDVLGSVGLGRGDSEKQNADVVERKSDLACSTIYYLPDLGSSVDVNTSVTLTRQGGLIHKYNSWCQKVGLFPQASPSRLTPTVLTTPKHKAPLSKQYLIAKMVSAVSPDWDTKMATSSLKTGVFRSRKSEAATNIPIRPRQTRPRWVTIALTQFDGNGNLGQLLEDGSDLIIIAML